MCSLPRERSDLMSYRHPVYQTNGYEEFVAWRDYLLEGAPPSFKGIVQMSTGIRVAGCCCLFMDSDAQLFSQCLSVSARSYAHFLDGTPPGEQAISLGAAFFDGLACNDFDAAALIAERSAESF